MSNSDNLACRVRALFAINSRLSVPTLEQREVLREHGCETWADWVEDRAETHGISLASAFACFELLGVEEAFDGFVVQCEDMESMLECEGFDE